MYNVVTKSVIAIALGVAMIGTSCGNRDKELAESLLTQSTKLYESGDYGLALELLDSIDKAYPAEVDIRRQAMHLRPQVIEKQTLVDLQAADSIAVVQLLKGDSLNRLLSYVSNPVEGYYVGTTAKGIDVGSVPGLHARMSPDGQFYILSTSKRLVKSTSFSVACNGEEARSSVVEFDGERNDRSSGVEIITFIQAECDSVGKFVMKHRNEPLTLTIHGSSSYSMPLPENQREAIAQVYETAMSIRDCKLTQLNKARLEKQLSVARSQMAKTFNESKSQDNI